MFGRGKNITIKVDDGVLWIGSAAYPVRNIVRAETVEVHWRRGRALLTWFVQSALIVGVGVVAAQGAAEVEIAGLTHREAAQLVTLVTLGLLGVRTLFLLRVLFGRTLWAMVLETSASSQAAVVNPDRREIDLLVHAVVQAIQRPATHFVKNITNYNSNGGVQNIQTGGHNRMKVPT